MNGELGTSVHASSLSAYGALVRKPAPLRFAVAVVCSALLAGWMCWLYAQDRQAQMCYGRGGTLVGGSCKAPTIEVKHYTVTLPPSSPDNDVPPPQPVIPDNAGPAL